MPTKPANSPNRSSNSAGVPCSLKSMSPTKRLLAMVAAVGREFGRLDIFVSNAAYSDEDVFYRADMTGFRRTIDVTMWGAFYGLRAAARQMLQQGGGGNIVVISSV